MGEKQPGSTAAGKAVGEWTGLEEALESTLELG